VFPQTFRTCMIAPVNEPELNNRFFLEKTRVLLVFYLDFSVNEDPELPEEHRIHHFPCHVDLFKSGCSKTQEITIKI